MLAEFKPMKFDGIKIMLEKYFPDYHLSNKGRIGFAVFAMVRQMLWIAE